MTNTVFLTGGSGFVGRRLISYLTEKGYAVYALARSAHALEKVEAVGARGVLGDLANLSAARPILERCEMVVHSAAYMDFTYDAEKFYQVNVRGTENLAIAAEQAGIKRFVHISAASIINGKPIRNVDEVYRPRGLPKDNYSKTKALAERLVLAADKPGFRTIALRPPAVWGPNNPHQKEMLEMAKQGSWIWIGGGKHVLSTIHVDNLAAAVEAALQSELGGEFYYVTDGEQRSIERLFSEFFRAEGIEPGDRSLPRGVVLALARVVEFFWKLFRLKTRPPIAPIMVYLMGTEFSVIDRKARTELGYRNAIAIDVGLSQLRQN